jgi:pimeloyl-ACP methyl ester carboxylesterase/DNA-binding winged helix-turn-helix (wHTH) protein
MAVPTLPDYEFGPFRLEVAERRLSRRGRHLPLQDKLFDTLLMMVRNRGRLLEKGAIMQAVWPDAHVEETNLPHSISMIRKILGDRRGARYVETVPKHGYRFVADVREIAKTVVDDTRPIPQARPAMPASRSAIPATRYARAGDVTVAYQVCGEGPIDLVYVPGWITHLEYGWQQPRVAHMLHRLAAFSRLILFDKRGTGLSDRTQGYPTLDDRMDDVRAVMDAVKSERAAVFGMSEGGSMSTLFAATHPDRTLALVLYGTFAKRTWSPDYPWAPTPDERQRWYEELERGWGGKTDLDRLAPSLAHDEAFVEWWSTYLRLGASPGAAMALARFNTQIDTRALLPAIQVPTLILHRTGDGEVKIDEARYLAARIPGSALIELPGDDHLIYAGDVDPLIDAVQRFVSAAAARRPVERVLSTIVVLDANDNAAPGLFDLVGRCCAAHHGKMLRSSSSRWIMSFDGPGRAISAACDTLAATRHDGVTLRAGIHTGECEMANGALAGPPVVIASELAATALAGTVIATRTVTDLVVGSPFRFKPRGTARVRDAGGWAVYEALIDPRAT